MSYNSNFDSNFPPNFTFHNPQANFIPPPPIPPAFFIPPNAPPPILKQDQDYVKQYNKLPSKPIKHKDEHPISISEVKEKLRNLVLTLNKIKDKEIYLKENTNTISEHDWTSTLSDIEKHKSIIKDSMACINDSYLDMLKKMLAKRSAKRLRMKRLKLERRLEKKDRFKELEERSRKIDENLQKIKDDIIKAEQEEEAKLQADMVLREVLRKKHDAKKCITKLDALVKLYKARQNTAKGRGESISEKDAECFNNNIEKLKSLWIQKLHSYEKEESELRATLNQDKGKDTISTKDAEVLGNLAKWRRFLFGSDCTPQADFQRDVGKFITRRSQWDQYIHSEGSSLPIGWVLPDFKTS
uniref:Programmed cell death protein 7 n=1 Tax=Pectinophora gossypiella TaxID=13191 RepID=A0A1E1W5G1_PECGO